MDRDPTERADREPHPIAAALAAGPAADRPAEGAFLPVVLGFVFLSVASGTMINVALPFIGEDLDASESTYGLVVSGFMLTFGVFSAVHGRLGDVFGVRRLYLGGAGVFFAGAIASALAPGIGWLVGVRTLQGIGAAAIPALGATIVTRMLPPERRGAAMGAVVATVGVSASLSPFLGGILLQTASWRVVLAVPALGMLAVPLAWRALPVSLDEVRAVRFDVVGAALLCLGATGLLLATQRVESAGLGGSTLALLGGGLASCALFVAWIHRAEVPFAPPSLLREPRFVASAALGALVNGARFGGIVLVPILLKEAGVAPLAIGGALFPGAAALAVLSPVAGRWADRVGARRAVLPGVLGTLLTCVAMIWLVDRGVFGVTLAMTLSGAAFAFVQPPILGALGTVVPREAVGVGNGLYLMVFFLGGAFGVSFALAVLATQPEGAACWLPGVSAGAGRFANTAAALCGLAAATLAVWPLLPGRPERPALPSAA